jgi:hypothetical protein
MIPPDQSNFLFSLASDFINHTARSVFLTGKAGTGKTTFLRHIRNVTNKNAVVVAPTGVAAINAGGMTIHSFFQIPPAVFLPGNHPAEGNVRVLTKSALFKNHHISHSKRELFREMELLIIDEVSMVRCDLLDLMDTILRHARKSNRPFGGVQVLFIGDLFQLPPVAQNEEWSLLKQYYQSPFFFHSKAVMEAAPLCIELQKIYRQNELGFIRLLNNVRHNEIEEEDLVTLNARFSPEAKKVRDHIVLTTHNYKADAINKEELEKLPGPAFRFQASIEGDFGDKSFPTDASLSLKKGARIMFIRNDASEERLYFNGKLAEVKDIDENRVIVEFMDGGEEFELKKEKWENIRYTYKEENEKIEEEELGSFTQYPVRLAWAITIHKSQGLTFENVIIDAGDSFTPGQVYVALSRCTSLKGLALSSRITRQQISTDPQVIEYSRQLQKEEVMQEILQMEKEHYAHQMLIGLFNFDKVQEVITLWAEEVPDRKLPDVNAAIALSREAVSKANDLIAVAEKFQKQLEDFLSLARIDKDYSAVYERTEKAVDYFNRFLRNEIFQKLDGHIQSLKGKSKVKKYLREVKEVALVIHRKGEKLRAARLGERTFYHGQSPELEKEPESIKIKPKKERGNSALESLELFRKGLDMATIASQRELAVSTIEGHIAGYVKTGEISVHELVDPSKVEVIIKAIQETEEKGFNPVKQKLGDAYSYGEIRAVANHLEWLEKVSQEEV